MRAILRKMPAYSLQLRYHYAAPGEIFEAANLVRCQVLSTYQGSPNFIVLKLAARLRGKFQTDPRFSRPLH